MDTDLADIGGAGISIGAVGCSALYTRDTAGMGTDGTDVGISIGVTIGSAFCIGDTVGVDAGAVVHCGFKGAALFTSGRGAVLRAATDDEVLFVGLRCTGGTSGSAPLATFPVGCPRFARRVFVAGGRASLFISPRSSCNCCCNNSVAGAISSQPGSERLFPFSTDQESTDRGLPQGGLCCC